MAVRDRGGDDMIYATQTIRTLRTLVWGILGDDSEVNVTFGDDGDVEHALKTWELKDYRFTRETNKSERRSVGYREK